MSGRNLDHYSVNSVPALQNLVAALRVFNESNGDLDQRIDPMNGSGEGTEAQPDTVRETFLWAINPDKNGGIQQTIQAMNENLRDLEIKYWASEIVANLKTLPL